MKLTNIRIEVRYTTTRSDDDQWLAYWRGGIESARGRSPEEAVGKLMLVLAESETPTPLVEIHFHNPRPRTLELLAGKGGVG